MTRSHKSRRKNFHSNIAHQSSQISQQQLVLLDCFARLYENTDVCSHILSYLVPESLCSMRQVSTQFYKIIDNYHLLDCHAEYILEKIKSTHVTLEILSSIVWILNLYPNLNNKIAVGYLVPIMYCFDKKTRLGYKRASIIEKVSVIVKHMLRESSQPTQLLTQLRLVEGNASFVERILDSIMEDTSISNRLNLQVLMEEACIESNIPVVKLMIDKRWADPTQDNYRCFKVTRRRDELWACLLRHPAVDKKQLPTRASVRLYCYTHEVRTWIRDSQI